MNTKPQARTPVPFVWEAGWAPGPFWTAAENFDSTGIQSPNHLARRESLYRLSYPGPPCYLLLFVIYSGRPYAYILITVYLSDIDVENNTGRTVAMFVIIYI